MATYGFLCNIIVLYSVLGKKIENVLYYYALTVYGVPVRFYWEKKASIIVLASTWRKKMVKP